MTEPKKVSAPATAAALTNERRESTGLAMRAAEAASKVVGGQAACAALLGAALLQAAGEGAAVREVAGEASDAPSLCRVSSNSVPMAKAFL